MKSQYSEGAQKIIEETMYEFSRGTLRSNAGYIVTGRNQALAIGISRAEEKGYKVPKQN